MTDLARDSGLPEGCIIVIAGGNGFIGSHVAKFYFDSGYHVRVVDIAPKSKHDDEPFYTERIIGDLCDLDFCRFVTRKAHAVFHFAAIIGGMGVIHTENDHHIYRANHSMTQSLLVAATETGIQKFFFASSACVYPTYLQGADNEQTISLREHDVYHGFQPAPQHLYGLEKLNSEQLVLHHGDRMHVYVARFHNVYGPRSSWNDGFEKAPAAFVRKAIAARHLFEVGNRPPFEIWGDGRQTRSFLYIDDAVRAVVALVVTPGAVPALNIGSDESISMDSLARLSLQTVGLGSDQVDFLYKPGPVGVANRNSNNDLVSEVLSWHPKISHIDGLQAVQAWMMTQVSRDISSESSATQFDYMRSLLSSRVVNLSAEKVIRFAILLPITSRPVPDHCIERLTVFARSLNSTTWRDRNEPCTTQYEARVYLAIDDDDEYLLPSTTSDGRAECVLRRNGFSQVITLRCHYPRGYVCALWRESARRAYQDQCDYYVLMGEDVELLDEGWMRTIDKRFKQIAEDLVVPHGFGCVTFTDISFAGMPTFPVLHRIHMNIFNGEVVPEDFINQDGDPYLFQLYRHFGASAAVSCRLQNTIGGSDDARYTKTPLTNWSFDTLTRGKGTVQEWAGVHAPNLQAKLSLDVIVPSFRVDIEGLSRIMGLQSSPTCTTMFIIIIDNPKAPDTYRLQHMNRERMDVRIRINKSNLGASASRNRGLAESSAEWVAFLDDDVVPDEDYLVKAEEHIRQHPEAAGFVGNSLFPQARNVFTTAIHLGGVTFFWDIATKLDSDIPWGVTANLIARRNLRDNVEFSLTFPKTGGGEDIDYCRKKRAASLARQGTGFWPAPNARVTHPWWNSGQRSYRRFYMWAKGDGALIRMYPELSWRNLTPNSAEVFSLSGITFLVGLGARNRTVARYAVVAAASRFCAEVLHDAFWHLLLHRDRARRINTSLRSVYWVMAVLEGGLIRMTSEMGRLVGQVQRREWTSLGKRFDWFAGGPWSISEERRTGMERMALSLMIGGLFVKYSNVV